jgi:hypothetical protein
MMLWLSLAALILAGFLAWNVYHRFIADRIQSINEKRRSSSRLVSRGEFVDGNRHLEVALALDQSTFYYENADMQASVDLQFIREIEYDSELATGTDVGAGRVLRLRSDSQTFEFVLPAEEVTRWNTTLPPRASRPPLTNPAAAKPEVADGV